MIGAAFDLRPRIELAAGEVPAPLNRPVVSHLDNPGAGSTLRSVEDAALPLNEDEQVLNEIFRLRGIPQDTDGDATDDSLISFKEKAQSFLVAVEKPCQQVFVRGWATRWPKVSALTLRLLGQREGREPGCSERAHLRS